MNRWLRLSVLLVALGASIDAFAQQATDSEPGKSLAGNWEISTPDRERRCNVSFVGSAATPPATVGKLTLGAACDVVFPALPDAVTWRLDPDLGLLLLDAHGQTIIEFTEVEAGTYEGERREDGIFVLQPIEVATAGWYTADQIAGEWAFVPKSATAKPVCLVTLSRDAVGPDTYRLVLKPNCDRAVSDFAPVAWRMERTELVLGSGNGIWRFEEVEPLTWQRIPPINGGMFLVRQDKAR